MIITLPHDVENYIYEFLIMPLDICKLRCISKYHNIIIDNTVYIKGKNLLKERSNMLLEDTNSYNEIISHKWEYYSKWYWPRVCDDEKNFTPLWKVGQYVDALDKIQVWGSAIILEQKLYTYPHNKIIERQYHLQFLGWSSYFNEWITADKITFFGSKTINPRNKMKSLNNIHKRWVLYNNSKNYWTMEILTIREDKKNKKIIQLVGFQNNVLKLDTITPENINNKLRSVTNATVLFSLKDRKFNDTRILKY